MTNASLAGLITVCVFAALAVLPVIVSAIRPKRPSTHPAPAARPATPQVEEPGDRFGS